MGIPRYRYDSILGVHGCMRVMFCNIGFSSAIADRVSNFELRKYASPTDLLDRVTSSHYALCSEIFICYKESYIATSFNERLDNGPLALQTCAKGTGIADSELI